MAGLLNDDYFMRQAWMQAQRAFEEEEIPIGAVVVSNNLVIGKGYNQVERLQDPSAHAEMLAITAACEYLGAKYLQDCTLYVTIEPCPMCAAASRWAQIHRVVYGAREPKYGYQGYQPTLLHPRTVVTGGVMEEECRELMQRFFAMRRN